MDILLATNHLFSYTGSEITLLTIAEELKQKGNAVSIYAKYIDPKFVEEIVHIAPVFDDLTNLKHKEFEVAYIQHCIPAMEVRRKYTSLPIIYASLGVLPFLEQPPPIDLGISKYLAISEETKENLMKKGVSEDSIAIFRNIVNSEQFHPITEINPNPKKAVIYSYKINEEKIQIIKKSCTELGIKCAQAGFTPGNIPQHRIPDILNNFDIVFTLGRGVIETMMCGRIPFVFDYQGGDGLVTPERVKKFMTCNFSGRLYHKEYSVATMVEEIKKYDQSYGPLLRNMAIDLFDSKQVVKKLIIFLTDAAQQKTTVEVSPILDKVVDIINSTVSYTLDACNRKNVLIGLRESKWTSMLIKYYRMREHLLSKMHGR